MGRVLMLIDTTVLSAVDGNVIETGGGLAKIGMLKIEEVAEIQNEIMEVMQKHNIKMIDKLKTK